ncbi:MAG: ABC transporter permease [Planctomycetaceae bacterium]|jgi:putative ABC transport system permease protein|nr:ABC transporter permease [Planctomycetaceae bacterium]
MNLGKIAWRSIEHRALASILTAFSMALGVALVVTVLVVHSVINQSFQRSAQGYNLLIGPKGSQFELVFSSVFYISPPKSRIPYRLYEEIQSKKLYATQVEKAIPVAISESYKDAPVVATYPEFFNMRYGNDNGYRFRRGESFKDSDIYGAVVGAEAAKHLKMKVGDAFYPHIGSGTLAKDENRKVFVVRGILASTGTPNDQVIFINLEGFYEMLEGTDSMVDLAAHGSTAIAQDAKRERELSAILIVTTETERKAEMVNEFETGTEDSEKKTTLFGKNEKPVDIDTSKMGTSETFNPAVLSFPEIVESNTEYQIQAVYPVRVVTDLFDQIIGNIQFVLIVLACLVIVVAGIGMMVSIYNTMNERRQEIAIMRALGAKRRTVMLIILLESLLLSLAGGVAGFVFGHMMIGILSPWVGESVKVPVSALQFQPVELFLIPGLTLLASIVGYLPAIIAYRTDVAQSLNP